MLSVEPKLRPSCAQILEIDFVKRKMEKLFESNEIEFEDEVIIEEDTNPNDGEAKASTNELLNTIKVPNNLAQLTNRLPKANYNIRTKKTEVVKSKDLQNLLSKSMPKQQPSTGRIQDQKEKAATEEIMYANQRSLPHISSMKTLQPESSPIQNHVSQNSI